MLRVALTGGIASGKSTVARLFEDRGVRVIHTDEISRKVVEPDTPGLSRLVSEFGSGILDDKQHLDRRKLREIVFSDGDRRRELEAILHPLIRDEMNENLKAISAHGDSYVIIEIPLLVETGAPSDFDRVLLVDCDESIQLERLMKRDQVDLDSARAALSSQASRAARIEAADDVIDNSDASIEELAKRVAELDTCYGKLGSE